MLVLLIIFMVTAPMMQRGLEIQFRRRRRPADQRGTVYVTLPLSYRKDKRVAIGPLGKEEMVPISVLGERARQALVSRQTKQVFCAWMPAERQEFLNMMDTLKAGGVEAIGLVALDDEENRPGTRQGTRPQPSASGGGAPELKMEAIVSDILQSRKREPDGLKKTRDLARRARGCRGAHSADPECHATGGAAAPRGDEHQPRRSAWAERRRDADDRWTANSGRATVNRAAGREKHAAACGHDAAEDGLAGSEAEATDTTEARSTV